LPHILICSMQLWATKHYTSVYFYSASHNLSVCCRKQQRPLLTLCTIFVDILSKKYNVQRHIDLVRITTAIMKELRINSYECLCTYYCLTYPVCKAHAPYHIDISEMSGYTITLNVITYTEQLHTLYNFRKKYLKWIKLFLFNLQLFSGILLILRTQSGTIKVQKYSCHMSVICHIFLISDFRKYSNIKLMKIF
jgi:hypothetical protein